jgi:hypothetical protein
MSPVPPLQRADLLGILAALGGRDPGAVPEEVGSLELTWAITELEQRYSVVLDLSDEALARVRTVDDAVEVLGAAIAAALAARAGR